MAKGMGIKKQQQHNIIIPSVKSYNEPDMKNQWWQTLLINDRVEAAEHNKLLILCSTTMRTVANWHFNV